MLGSRVNGLQLPLTARRSGVGNEPVRRTYQVHHEGLHGRP